MELKEFSVLLPIKTVSELNTRDHYMKVHKRRSQQRRDAHWLMKGNDKPSLPVSIKLTRISPRRLDHGDNLNASMKAIRDGIADWLGVDDGNERIFWDYFQTRPSKGETGVLVRVRELTSTKARQRLDKERNDD